MNQRFVNNSFLKSLKRYFKFDTYQAILKKEIIGGISTFLAMAYIIAINPSIIGLSPIEPWNAPDTTFASQYQGGLFLSTVISSCVATFIMGMYARIPVALAPGMGLNAFFAFTVAQQIGFSSALTVTILSGIGYFIVVITPAREKISKMIPSNLKLAIGVGIGFFIAYIGLQNTGIVVKNSSDSLVSNLGNLGHPMVLLAIVLLVVGLILHYAKVPNAIIITMILGAIILIPIVVLNATGVEGYSADNINPLIVGYKNFETFPSVLKAAWEGFANVEMWKNPITYIGVLSFLYMDFFDTTGTLITIDKSINLSQKDIDWLKKASYVDAISTIMGASIGATTVTSFVESTVGVSAGARTGFASIITALCFGLSIALWPIIQIFMPVGAYQPITGPILIIVGTIMINQIKHFEWEILIDIPTLFITIIVMTLSNSIAYGIAFGTITFVLLNGSLGIIQLLFKKSKKIINTLQIPMSENGVNIIAREFYYCKRLNWTLILISVLSIAYIILQNGMTYLGWFI